MKRTSDQWQLRCKTIVMDPDGWDRKNYYYSWNVEKITRKEFEKRLIVSTCQYFSPFGNCIWKDLPYRFFFNVSKFFKMVFNQILKELQRDSVWDILLPKICLVIAYIIGGLSGAYLLVKAMDSLFG